MIQASEDMRTLKGIFFLIVLVSSTLALGASPTITLASDALVSFVELENDSITLRTHGSFGGEVVSVGYPLTKNLELSLGFTVVYTTRSLIYEHTFVRPSIGYGPSVGLTTHFTDRLFFTTQVAYLFYSTYHYDHSEQRYRITLRPSYQVVTFGSWGSLLLAIPASIEWKESLRSISFGFGLAFKVGGLQ